MQFESVRCRIDYIYSLDRCQLTTSGRALRGPIAVDVPFDRFGVEWRPVVVFDVLLQRERDLSSIAGCVPLFSQPGDDLAAGIDAHQRVVDLVVNVAVDERARAHRVEIDDVVLEGEGDRATGGGWLFIGGLDGRGLRRSSGAGRSRLGGCSGRV